MGKKSTQSYNYIVNLDKIFFVYHCQSDKFQNKSKECVNFVTFSTFKRAQKHIQIFSGMKNTRDVILRAAKTSSMKATAT